MNPSIASRFRLTLLAVTLIFAVTSASAKRAAPVDESVELLARYGALPVKVAGSYVEMGTFLIQVTTKLGQPSVRLPDGAWLYRGYHVQNSDAHGTLVIRFAKGRVSDMALVTPAFALAMMTASADERAATKPGVVRYSLCSGESSAKSLK